MDRFGSDRIGKISVKNFADILPIFSVTQNYLRFVNFWQDMHIHVYIVCIYKLSLSPASPILHSEICLQALYSNSTRNSIHPLERWLCTKVHRRCFRFNQDRLHFGRISRFAGFFVLTLARPAIKAPNPSKMQTHLILISASLWCALAQHQRSRE